MAKQLVFSEEARRGILEGVTLLSKAVKATLGPKGRNVIIDKKFGTPAITKDGVTCKDVQGTPEEHKTLRESYEHLCKLRDEVISMGIIPPVSERGGLNPNLK